MILFRVAGSRLGLLGIAAAAAFGCASHTASTAGTEQGSGPGPVPQPAGVFFDALPGTAPAGSVFGVALCERAADIPADIPADECEGLPDPVVYDAAVDGQRLVVAMEQDRTRPNHFTWDLLVSDDLGKTARRFALSVPLSNVLGVRLQLLNGRIFLFGTLDEPFPNTNETAVFEVDPQRGGVTRIGQDTLGAMTGYTSADGVFTTVAFQNAYSPDLPFEDQQIVVARFDPKSNSVQRSQIPCDDLMHCSYFGGYPAKAPVASSAAFVSDDGDVFSIRAVPQEGPTTCLLSVSISANSLNIDCPPVFGSPPVLGYELGWPFTSFGGSLQDFELRDPSYSPSIVPLTQHWIPSGDGAHFGGNSWMRALANGLFLYSETGLAHVPDEAVGAEPGALGPWPRDTILLRALADGTFQGTQILDASGCLSLGAPADSSQCWAPTAVVPLQGDDLLIISAYDDFHDDRHTHSTFGVGTATPTWQVYQP